MAQWNEWFVRTLRDSHYVSPGRPSGARNQEKMTSPNCGPYCAPNLSSTTMIIKHCHTTTSKSSRQPKPPDLLANLLPARHSETETKTETRSGKADAENGLAKSTDLKSTVVKSVALASRKLLSSLTGKCESHTVKEYVSPISHSREPSLQRRCSVAVGNISTEDKQRVVPSWFPPNHFHRLSRPGSFHGETNATKILKAKKMALERIATEERTTKFVEDSSSYQAEQEPNNGRGLGSRELEANKNRALHVRKELSTPKRTAETAAVCPRHEKHHNKDSSESCDTSRSLARSGSTRVAKDIRSKANPKFGTLPRSFRLASASKAPLSCRTSNPTRHSESTAFRSYGRHSLRSRPPPRPLWNRTMSTAVERADVSLAPEETTWVKPLITPAAENVCTCGDLRPHVHLVTISEDLTLTDTRYFIGEPPEAEQQADKSRLESIASFREEPQTEPQSVQSDIRPESSSSSSAFAESFADSSCSSPPIRPIEYQYSDDSDFTHSTTPGSADRCSPPDCESPTDSRLVEPHCSSQIKEDIHEDRSATASQTVPPENYHRFRRGRVRSVGAPARKLIQIDIPSDEMGCKPSRAFSTQTVGSHLVARRQSDSCFESHVLADRFTRKQISDVSSAFCTLLRQDRKNWQPTSCGSLN